jgi:endonuclease YncB( thermonuclease family)
MISLFLFLAVQSTDFGVREVGVPVPSPKQLSRGQARSSVAGGTFSCSVSSITDGDTLRCADGTRVRLAGIDAPEISPCALGRQCTPGDGNASRQSLASMASGRTLSCQAVGTSYKRVVAFCRAGGTDLSCAQVRSGHAVRRYSAKNEVCR